MLVPIILCGGSGTRLWPLSRSHAPKQLQTLVGDESMLQATARRLDRFSSEINGHVSAPIVVCNDAHRYVTRRHLLEVGHAHSTVITEPVGRNSAPALTVAALRATAAWSGDKSDPVLLVMASDHVIADVNAFHAGVATAAAAATNATRDVIVTFGIVPTEPATGFGYLRVGATSASHPDAYELNAFIEKPTKERAQAYLSDGGYLWNSGMFVVRASVWLRAMRALAPAMLAACERALSSARISQPIHAHKADANKATTSVGQDYILDEAAFNACPSDSIDYAVMEKLASHPELRINGAIVPLDCGWNDVGSWDSAWDVSAKDEQGNVLHLAEGGEVLLQDTRDTYVHSSGPNPPLIACIGLESTVVVHTHDAILIADKSKAQEVKAFAVALTSKDDPRAKLHRKVFRPWGWYDSLACGANGTGFQIKHISVYPGHSLSLQLHHKRAEHWVVLRGVATIRVGDNERDYQIGDHVFIPVGEIHRLGNNTTSPVELIEVQMGDYLGEDDIVRLSDVYGRLPESSGAQK